MTSSPVEVLSKKWTLLFEAGAKEVYLAITHPILVGAAMESLRSSPIKELIVTNTVPVPERKTVERKSESAFHRAVIV